MVTGKKARMRPGRSLEGVREQAMVGSIKGAAIESTAAVLERAIKAHCRSSEVALLFLLFALYCGVYSLNVTPLFGLMNVLGPIALTAILGWSCYRILQESPLSAWAPLLWFRVASAVYFGVGALVPHVVNEETRSWIFGLFRFDEHLNIKVNLIYTAGIWLTLLFSAFFLRVARRPMRASPVMTSQAAAPRTTFLFSIALLVLGGGLRYGIVLPYSYGLLEITMPGALIMLSKMYYAGVYLLVFYGVQFDRRALLFAIPIVAFDIAVSVASFAKTEILLILIFALLGFLSQGASLKRISLGVTVVAVAFLASQPLIGYGRDQLLLRYGEIRGAGLGERISIIGDYIVRGDNFRTAGGRSGLARLSYINANAFVIDQFDSGRPGSTLRNAAAVLVPRALWPEKPIITQLGADLNVLVFGRGGSQLGVGHFAESYWNFGWSGIPLFMAVLSFILSAFTRFSIRVMAMKQWLFFPVVLIGVNMGLRVDGHFVPDILGPAWMAICLWAITSIALHAYTLIKRPQRRWNRSEMGGL